MIFVIALVVAITFVKLKCRDKIGGKYINIPTE